MRARTRCGLKQAAWTSRSFPTRGLSLEVMNRRTVGAAAGQIAGFTLLSLGVLTGRIGLDNKRHRLTL